MTEPTVDALYADLAHAKLMLRQCTGTEDRILWRTEIGRLTQEIRRAGMDAERGRDGN